MSYLEKTFRPHLRLTLLRLLHEAPEYSLNASILRDGAQAAGLTASRDQIESEIAWLSEQDLVTVTSVGSLTIARLTLRGHDVAAGSAVVPGVKRPSP